MRRPDIKAPIVPSWVVSLLAATCALVILGFVSIGFFASFGGLVIAGAVALTAGTVVAGVVDPNRARKKRLDRGVLRAGARSGVLSDSAGARRPCADWLTRWPWCVPAPAAGRGPWRVSAATVVRCPPPSRSRDRRSHAC